MKKRILMLILSMILAMTASMLAFTACNVADKTPDGEDTGITEMENADSSQYYIPIDTDGDGVEDQAAVIVMGNTEKEETPEENYTPVSEMTFEKRPEIDSDGMFMQYGPILIEFGVSSMEDIKVQIEKSGIPQWETFGENIESDSFCTILDSGLGFIATGKGGFKVFFINFEEGNDWGYESGYRAVYTENEKPVGGSSTALVRVSNDYIWFSDSAAAFFEEHGDGFSRDGYNVDVFSPVEDYYGFVRAE